MREVYVVSFPYSGTHFTQRVLRDLGFNSQASHLHHPGVREWFADGRRIVVPVRTLEMSEATAVERGQQVRPRAEWDELMDLCNLPFVHRFDVLNQVQDEADALCRFLEVEPIPFDWTPVKDGG